MFSKNRSPAVAGSFYPDSANQLSQDIDDMLAQQSESNICPKAIIVPHAGYYYSGEIAASAYKLLMNIQTINRVILLGPSHRSYLTGCAVPSYDSFSTPLGTVDVDQQSCQQLITSHNAIMDDDSHVWEHSLEVQLPFLQRCLANFTIIPITVGKSSPAQVSKLINQLYCNEKNLLVISSDLSHFHSSEEAIAIDNKSVESTLNLLPMLMPEQACGCYAINGLLAFAKQQNWQIKLIQQCHSGDISSDNSRVVGYASFALY